MAIGEAGAVNAGILAAQIVGLTDSQVQSNLAQRRKSTAAEVEAGTFVSTDDR